VILVLHADGRITLDEPHDFTRFHCEIDRAHATVEAANAAFTGTAEIESRETAWVDMSALFALGQAASGDAAQRWTASAERMVEGAAKYGWVRERAPSIKSHIVWRD
jgi:hypothetical protein